MIQKCETEIIRTVLCTAETSSDMSFHVLGQPRSDFKLFEVSVR
jgi:hypothetical protein